MLIKFPKDDQRWQWTNHVKGKMIQYLISESLIKRIIKSPKRLEEGVAEGTVASMKPAQSKRSQEIWVMFRRSGQRIKVISAWRYPGISPIGKKIYIPADTLEYLAEL